jgi:putative ABC transport system substrate-binding protein
MTNNTPFVAGALISYDGDRRERHRQMAGYVSRILTGANPSDLPIQQPAPFELCPQPENRKALGL